jgi:tRNA(fMet)-specific endonuclease VapC
MVGTMRFQEYGKLRGDLAAQGSLIGPNDLMIAATALANGLVPVTHNTAACRA